MKTPIKDLAQSKLAGYIAFLFYLGFLGGAFFNYIIAVVFLVAACIFGLFKIYYDIKFTWKTIKEK